MAVCHYTLLLVFHFIHEIVLTNGNSPITVCGNYYVWNLQTLFFPIFLSLNYWSFFYFSSFRTMYDLDKEVIL